MFKLAAPILPLLLILLAVAQAKETPDMVVVLTRHGAREPLNSFYDDSWRNPTFLMNAGIEQHYALGTFLAKKYSDLLQDILPQEIYLQATYASRTQMSISAELLGIFSAHSHKHQATQDKRDFLFPYADEAAVGQVADEILEKQSMIPNRLQFLQQTIRPRDEEDLIQITPKNCDYVGKRQDERFEDAENKKIQHLLKDTFTSLQALGYDVKDMSEMKEFGDALASRYSDNKPPLEGIPYDGKIYNDTIFGFKWWNIYNLLGDDYERGLKVYPLYDRLVEWFNNKAQGENPLKLVLLGGHESSMFPFLNLYNITNHTCFTENYKSQMASKAIPFPDCQMPEVASQLIWEFYNNTGNPYIKMVYNGKQYKFCRDSEGLDCSLKEFAEELPLVTSNLTPSRWLQVCAAGYSLSRATLQILLTITMATLGVIIGLLLYLWLSKKIVLSYQYAKGIPTEHGDNEVLKTYEQQTFESSPSHQPRDVAI
jgi:hypothetical protein